MAQTTTVMPEGRQRYYNNDGTPCAGGKLYTYAAGTSALKTAYQDADGTIPHPNPIPLDAHGEAVVYWAGAYKVDLKQADGQQVTGYPVDGIKTDPAGIWGIIAALAAAAGSALLGYIQDGVGAVRLSVQDVLRETVSAKRFGARGDGVTDDTAAMDKLLAHCVKNGLDAVLTDGTYLIGHLAPIALPAGGKLTVRGASRDRCTIKIAPGAYAANTSPALAITGANDVAFRNVTIDQNWIGTAYPAGHSYADNAKASSWGGGSWVFDITTTGKVDFENCAWLNTFRGAMVKTAERLTFSRNHSDAMASLGQCVIAAEDCGSVLYDRNSLVARNWSDNPGLTGASGLFGISCENVQITNNYMRGHQLVFHGTTAAEGGRGYRIQVTGNMIDTPPADTAFYRWNEAVVSNNIVRQSGDMGIAVSDSSYITVTGNTIAGVHIGGIGLTNCLAGVVSGNVIKDIAQVYAGLLNITPRYGSNAGTFLSGIVTDYQAGGAQSHGLAITGNSLHFDTLPPVSDPNGPVRAKVYGILFDTTTNTAAQNTGVVTGNFLYQDAANLPNFMVMVPTHRLYLSPASRAGNPTPYETFSNGATSFRLLRDYGDGNLIFVDRLIGEITGTTLYTGKTSGAILVSAGFPQVTFLNCVAANNVDGTVTA